MWLPFRPTAWSIVKRFDNRTRPIHLTERGYAAAKIIRQAIREIEGELETELGPGQFAELRQLLVSLNATDTIRAHKPRTRGAART